MLMIDLNCDMGESFGNYRIGKDEEMLDYVSSSNIACGFHAGDPATMRKTVQLALQKNVAIGAHPGLQDLVGFGRRNIHMTPQEVYDLIIYQLGALQAFVKAEGGTLQHVKPHGALFNMSAQNADLATAIAKAVSKVDEELILFGLSGSESIKAGKAVGLRTASEVFSDRTYQQDGSLTARHLPNSLIKEPKSAVQQVIKMIKEKCVTSLQGTDIPIEAHTVCIHGDGENALSFAQYLVAIFEKEGIQIMKVSDLLNKKTQTY